MLLGAGFLASGPLVWLQYIRHFFPDLAFTEQISISIMGGFATSVWTGLFAAHIRGRLDETGLVSVVLIHIALHILGPSWSHATNNTTMSPSQDMQEADEIISLESNSPNKTTINKETDKDKEIKRNSKSRNKDKDKDDIEVELYVVWLLWLALVRIIWTHLLQDGGDEGALTGGNCYADLPFHLTVCNSLLWGRNSHDLNLFTLSEAIYDGARLIYPLVPDAQTALLVASGWSHRAALVAPSIAVAWALLTLLYRAGLRITRSGPASVVAVYAVVLCGGNFAQKEPHFWLYFVKDIILPQRSALYAYPMLLGALIALWMGLDAPILAKARAKRDPAMWSGSLLSGSVDSVLVVQIRHQYYQLSGLLVGLLPFVQGHAFISMGVIGPLTLLFYHVPRDLLSLSLSAQGSRVSGLFKICFHMVHWGGPALLLGAPQMFSFSAGAARWGFAHYAPMWTFQDMGPFQWGWDCLGFVPYVSLAGLLFCVHPQLRQRLVPFWILFVIALFFNFQPWEVDNMKIFYVCFFAMAYSFGLFCVRLAKLGYLPALVAIALFLSHAVPGLICLVKKELSEQYPVLSKADLEMGEWVRYNTGPESVFLTSTRHNHPVSTWGGKSLFYGYKGWLSSRGLDWSRRERIARKIIVGSEDALNLCKDNGIDYIALSNAASKLDGADINRPWLDKNMNRVFKNREWTIYEVRIKGKLCQKKMFGPLCQIPEGQPRQPDKTRH